MTRSEVGHPPFVSTAFCAGLVLAACSLLVASESTPLRDRIDREIEAAHPGPFAELAGDAEFFRRVTLDLVSRVPSVKETRVFLSDQDPAKRENLVDRLIASPEHSRRLQFFFDEMLMERRPQKHVPSAEWNNYLFESFEANKPWNVLASEMLSADGADPRLRAAAKFFLDREGDLHRTTRDLGRMFFGRDLECAQCHDHPLIDAYEQRDYYELHAFLVRTSLFTNKKKKLTMLAEKAAGEAKFKSVFAEEDVKEETARPRVPGGTLLKEPFFEKGKEYEVAPKKDARGVPRFSRRAGLARLASSGENDAFNRNIANRLWALAFGRGLVHPVDLHHRDNPPSHPRLLKILAESMVAMGFDIKAFLRELILSRTYQRSSWAPDLDVELAEAEKQVEFAGRVRERLNEAAQASRHAAKIATREFSAAEDSFDMAAADVARLGFALGAAEKAQSDAQASLDGGRTELTAKEAAIGPLREAAASSKEASARLPDDKELADAAAKLEKRTSAITADIEKLRKAIPEREKAVVSTTEKLGDARQSLADAEALRKELPAPLERLRTTAAARRKQAAADQRAAHVAEVDLENAEALVEICRLKEATGRSKERAGELAPASGVSKSVSESTAARAIVARNQLLSRRFAIAAVRPLSPEQLARSTLQALGMLEREREAVENELRKKAEDARKKAAEAKKEAKEEEAKEEKAAEPKAEARPKESAQKETAEAATRAAPIDISARDIERGLHEKLKGRRQTFVRLFGSLPGEARQDFQATVQQALFLRNGGEIDGWLNPSGENLTGRLAALKEPDEIADELYLSVLTRTPSQHERNAVTRFLEKSSKDAKDGRKAALKELAWALLTSVEFRFNH